MDEDEEEFYDSLEEDQNFEDTIEIIPRNETSKISIYETDAAVQKDPVRCTKIPLYVGETDKKDLKIYKKSTQNVVSANQSSNTCLSCVTTGKSKVKIENVAPKKKPDLSYWNIYCQKNGLPVEDESNINADTVRSLYGSTTNRTFSSFISSCCMSGNTWDAPSMFEKYMPKKYAAQKNELPTYEETDQQSSVTKCNSTEIDVENLKSVSQIDILKAPAKKSSSKMSANKIIKSQSNTSNISLRPLTLKSLGPNKSKLDLLKRQQEYGQRANSRNRARIIQNLSKLNQEIQNNSHEKCTMSR